MSDQRKKMVAKLYGTATTPQEKMMVQLAIERICADMCDFFERFYENVGPGAIVYVPEAEKEEDSMFYLTVDQLIAAQNDFRNKDMDAPAEVMQKTITRAEAIDHSKEALFLIQDDSHLSLIHYNRERPTAGPIIT